METLGSRTLMKTHPRWNGRGHVPRSVTRSETGLVLRRRRRNGGRGLTSRLRLRPPVELFREKSPTLGE